MTQLQLEDFASRVHRAIALFRVQRLDSIKARHRKLMTERN